MSIEFNCFLCFKFKNSYILLKTNEIIIEIQENKKNKKFEVKYKPTKSRQ